MEMSSTLRRGLLAALVPRQMHCDEMGGDGAALFRPMLKRFGDTALIVATRRRYQLWYRAPAGEQPADFRRRQGFEVEIKSCGNCCCPPSLEPRDGPSLSLWTKGIVGPEKAPPLSGCPARLRLCTPSHIKTGVGLAQAPIFPFRSRRRGEPKLDFEARHVVEHFDTSSMETGDGGDEAET